jgi:hypothetical protein
MPIKYTMVFMAFLATFLVSRIVSTGATKKLDAETRHRISDEFSPRSSTRTVLIVLFCAAYLLGITLLPGSIDLLTIIFFLGFLSFMVFNMLRTNARLRAIQAPGDFIRSIGLSWAIFIVGVGIIATAVVLL